MKKIRFLLGSLLILVLMLGCSFADTSTEQVKEIEYTRSEYIQRLAEVNEISLTNSEKYLNIKESNKLSSNENYDNVIQPLSNGFTTYHEFIVTKNFGSGKIVEQGVLYSRYNDLSFRQITGIDASWTAAVGSGTYTFEESYHTYSFTGSSITQMARGTVVVAIDMTASTGASLKAELIGLGFSISSQDTKTVYLRKADSWSGTLSIY